MSDRFSLDGEPGPARALPPEKAEEMIARAMGEARASRPWSAIAAGVAIVFAAGGSFAAWYAAKNTPPPQSIIVEQKPNTATVAAEVAEEPSEDSSEEPPAPRAVKRASPEDLLARANELRGKGAWREAERTYARVVRTHARSQAAYVAAIAAAAISLEHLQDPRGALAMYERARAISPSGPLDAEALFGIAGAERALGDRAAEKRALETLIEKHPDSPFVTPARARLDAR